MMATRSLGGSGMRVSAIGLGCWQFSQGKGILGRYWRVLGDEAITDIIRTSLNAGVNWFDTAEAYGWGASEAALARGLSSLHKSPGEILIATKWWPALKTARSLLATIDSRLNALCGYPIDLYQVHQPYGFSSVEKEMDAMARLIGDKKIRNVGVSNFDAPQMRRADARLRHHGLRLASNQVRYSLLAREIESNGILATAKELGVSIIAYSPLAQGLLTGKFHDDPEKIHGVGIRKYLSDFSRSRLERTRPLISLLKQVASAHGATPSQVALQWVVSAHGETIVAIPGATSTSHAKENAEAMDVELTQQELRQLDEASR